MPNRTDDYPVKITTGLWSNEDKNIFYYDFRIDANRVRGILDYSMKNWTSVMMQTVAKAQLNKIKDEKKSLLSNDIISLDTFSSSYFKTLKKTDWVKTKINHYDKYIKDVIGTKHIIDISFDDVNSIIKSQYQLGLKPRTIKTTLEVLSPIFKKAIENEIIEKNPCKDIKIELDQKQSKEIVNPHGKLQDIYQTLYNLFADDPFYLSLYLFALHGRNKGEILKLKWEYIDFTNNTYITKKGSKNFFLHPEIKEQLLRFEKKGGWIYESSHKSGSPISNIEKQTNKIKQFIPHFTIKFMQDVVKEVLEQKGLELNINRIPNLQNKKEEPSSSSQKKRVISPVKLKPKLNIGKFSKKT